MTEQKDPELVPSRELDAEVARALGKKVEAYGADYLVILPPSNPEEASYDTEPLPTYSSDMGACWAEVVPELERMNVRPHIQLCAEGWDLHVWNHGSLGPVLVDCAEALPAHLVPAALCRALLKVKKGEGK